MCSDHRPPRGFGFARQLFVAPVTIQWDKKSVEEGGKVVIGIRFYTTRKALDRQSIRQHRIHGAEVTSEDSRYTA